MDEGRRLLLSVFARQLRHHATAPLRDALRGIRLREALRGGWPLPPELAVHLWLYAEGWLPPTQPPAGSR